MLNFFWIAFFATIKSQSYLQGVFSSEKVSICSSEYLSLWVLWITPHPIFSYSHLLLVSAYMEFPPRDSLRNQGYLVFSFPILSATNLVHWARPAPEQIDLNPYMWLNRAEEENLQLSSAPHLFLEGNGCCSSSGWDYSLYFHFSIVRQILPLCISKFSTVMSNLKLFFFHLTLSSINNGSSNCFLFNKIHLL